MTIRIPLTYVTGVRGNVKTVEVIDVADGEDHFANTAAGRELRVRVRSAAGACAPFNIVCDGLKLAQAHDLAIAVAALHRDDINFQAFAASITFVAELSFTGELRPVKGIRARVTALRDQGAVEVVVAASQASAAATVPGIIVRGARTLTEVSRFVVGAGKLPAYPHRPNELVQIDPEDQVRSDPGLVARFSKPGTRVVIVGFPKRTAVLAQTISEQLRPSQAQVDTIANLADCAGLRCETAEVRTPYRAPHHSISAVSLAGTPTFQNVSEASLASYGVLYLDSIEEFRGNALEELGSVLRRGEAAAHVPANPAVVIGSARPCPCGRAGTDRCRCSEVTIKAYGKRIAEAARRIGAEVIEVA